MNALLAMTIIFLIFAVGDAVATRTRALISSILVCAIVFMVAFWLGFPTTVFSDSGLIAFANITIGMFLVHIGSTIKLKDLATEWKTVVVALVSTLAIAFGVYFIGSFIIDRYYALVGGPTIAGGMVAYLIMKDVADVVGREEIAVFALMVMSLQYLAGIPIASVLCKGEGKKLLHEWKAGRYVPVKEQEEGQKKSRFQIFPAIPARYESSNLILFKVALLALLGQWLGAHTGVNQLIYCLLFGILFQEIGLLEPDCLTKANAFSFVLAGALCTIYVGLGSTTPGMILSMLPSLLVVVALGVGIAAVISLIIGKAVHFDWRLSFAVAITALIGFPGTYLLSREVAHGVGKTEKEVKIVMDYIMPKMIIGGIVSVSVVSGIAASIMVNWI